MVDKKVIEIALPLRPQYGLLFFMGDQLFNKNEYKG
jgi:hypothetical protein